MGGKAELAVGAGFGGILRMGVNQDRGREADEEEQAQYRAELAPNGAGGGGGLVASGHLSVLLKDITVVCGGQGRERMWNRREGVKKGMGKFRKFRVKRGEWGGVLAVALTAFIACCGGSASGQASGKSGNGKTASAQQGSASGQSTTGATEKPKHSVQRLYMKDGSFQLVTQYAVKGDRVRYYSSERGGWEEVPFELVDMAATKKWLADLEAASRPAKVAAVEESAAEAAARMERLAAAQKAEDIAHPEVAPRLRLPSEGSFFAFDVYHNVPELVPMVQPEAERRAREAARAEVMNATKPKNRVEKKHQLEQAEAQAAASEARIEFAPALPPKARSVERDGMTPALELDHTAAKRQFHITNPVFYVRRGAVEPLQFVMLRGEIVPQKHGRRILPVEARALAVSGSTGKNYVGVKIEPMPGGEWMKMTLDIPLPMGEYALVRVLGPRQMDENVWDFGVHDNADENVEAIRPVGNPAAP